MNINQENQNNKKTGYYYFGIASGIISFISVITLALWYKYTGYIHSDKIQDVASSIFTPAGFFASISALMFVIDNLKLQREDLELQREEIKQNIAENKESNKHYDEQNKTMLAQQANNTFFSLLSHIQYLLEAGDTSEITKKLVTRYQINTETYRRSIATGYFSNFEETQSYPPNLLNHRGFSFNKINGYFDNVKQAIEFIHNEFKKDVAKETFYHNLFYNSLSVQDKIMLGILIECDLIQLNIDSDFDYKKTFTQDRQLFKVIENEFPVVEIETTAMRVQLKFLNIINCSKLTSFNFKYCKSKECHLTNVSTVLGQEKNIINKFPVKQENRIINENNNTFHLDFKPLLDYIEQKRLYEDKSPTKLLVQKRFDVMFELAVNYDNSDFYVYHHIEIYSHFQKSNNEVSFQINYRINLPTNAYFGN